MHSYRDKQRNSVRNKATKITHSAAVAGSQHVSTALHLKVDRDTYNTTKRRELTAQLACGRVAARVHRLALRTAVARLVALGGEQEEW
jgi:hypothetical protein